MYEDLKEILCHELNEITRKGELDKESLDDVYKLSSAITMVESLMKKSQQGGGEQGEMSNQSNYMPMWAYAQGGSNAGGSNAGGSNASNMSNAYAGGSNANMGSNAGGSNRGGSYDGGSYGSYENSNARGRSNESYEGGSNEYSEESYRRGRNQRTGRYMSRDSYEGGSYERGYSRHSAEEKAIMKMEEIAETTQNPKVKQAIMQAVEKLEQ